MGGGARRWASAPALALTVALLLTACGEEGGGLPSGSGSRTASLLPSRTASLPSPTEQPSRTRTAAPTEEPTQAPTEAPTESPQPSPTASEAPTKTAAPPSASPSDESPTREPTATPTSSATEPTSEAPMESATVSASASPDEDAAEGTASDASGVDAWVWWLIAFLVLLGGVLAAILVPRARRRRAWDEGLAEAETEARWLAQELIPQLQQAVSPAEVAGGWQVAAGRVMAAEDRLTGLETSAPDEARGARAVALRDAVRTARQGVEDLLVTRDPAALGRGLALLASRLSATLAESRST